MKRRWFLVACGAAALAGCTDGEPAAPGNETDGGVDDTDDTGDDDAGDDGDAADPPGDDDEPESTDEADDDTTDPEEQDEDGDGTDDSSDDETAQLGDALQFTESFAFEFEETTENGSAQGSGRVDGDDSYWHIETDDEVMEMYVVGDELYWVADGQCYRMDGDEPDAGDDVDADLEVPDEDELEEQPELEAVGRDQIDGEEVYVYELSADEAEGHDEAVTYYVSVETGYLRRMEHGDSVMDFHSWGDVDPVEAPDMDCTDVNEQQT